MNDYKNRVFDDILKFRMSVFGAVLISGPKGCGKTKTSTEFAKTKIEFQDLQGWLAEDDATSNKRGETFHCKRFIGPNL